MEERINRAFPQVDQVQTISKGSLCHACGQSGIGGRKENQDHYAGADIHDAVILSVCDGMGGMAGGQTASAIAANEIVGSLAKITVTQKGSEAIRIAVENANKAIYQRAVEEPPLRGMGTTTTVLVITKKAAYLTHVGDSRIYQLRKGKKIFRTFDHSKVFDMVAQGMMSEEQARQSSFSNVITRALGIRPQVEMDIVKLPFKKGDRFILCCDGIWNIQPEAEMLKLFVDKDNPEETITQLTEYVNSKGIDRGGDYDNLTAIIADMKCDSEYQYSWFHHLKCGTARLWKSFKSLFGKKNRKAEY